MNINERGSNGSVKLICQSIWLYKVFATKGVGDINAAEKSNN